MKKIYRPAVSSVALVALLSLAACVTPQIQKSTVSSAPIQTTRAASAPSAVSTNSETPAIASKKLKELLETQLLCPSTGSLAIELTRATAISERIIGRQGKAEPDGSTTYRVIGDLAVHGLKITALKFSGDDNSEGASIMAVVKATNAEVTKVFKSKRIDVKKSNFGPGLWAKRPKGLFAGVYEDEGMLKMGCVVPID